MTISTQNPKIEALRQRLRLSYEELNALIEGQLTDLEPHKLYEHPFSDEWTLMENLAHIVEFLPYWTNEITKLLASPGQPFGRTAEDTGRLRAISEHSHDTLAQLRATLPGSYALLDRVLSSLQDSDLALTGQHIKFGERPLEWFIDHFVASHLASHVVQIKEALKILATPTDTA